MSLAFWLDLLQALLGFVIAIAAIHYFRTRVFKDYRAKQLRRKLVPNLHAMQRAIAEQMLTMAPQASIVEDPYVLYRARADLEALFLNADVLFDQERAVLAAFLEHCSKAIARYDAGAVSKPDVDELLLLGQRAIHELTEIGL